MSRRKRQPPDYDRLIEKHVNGLSVAAAAESSGRWTPSDRSEALLNALAQILADRRSERGAS